MPTKVFADSVYILVDPSRPLWPATSRHGIDGHSSQGMDGVSCAGVVPKRDKLAAAAGMLETYPNGDRLLVGRDISELDSFTDQIKIAVISGMHDIRACGVASILGAPDRGAD